MNNKLGADGISRPAGKRRPQVSGGTGIHREKPSLVVAGDRQNPNLQIEPKMGF